jgi:hypothetical protein
MFFNARFIRFCPTQSVVIVIFYFMQETAVKTYKINVTT